MVITTKNSLPFHSSDHSNVLLALKQKKKGALNLPARSSQKTLRYALGH